MVVEVLCVRPVHHVPERFDEVGAAVLVLEVIGVLPDVEDQDAGSLAGLEHLVILERDDVELSRHVFVELMKRQFEPVMEAVMRLDAQLAELVASGQRNGEMRGDIAPLEVVHLLSDVYITTVHAWLFCLEEKGGDFDLNEGIRRRLDLVFGGLAEAKGGRR